MKSRNNRLDSISQSLHTTPSQPLEYLKVIARSDLSTRTRATCWAIASFVNNKTGKAFPSLKTLAKATGMSEAAISKHTKLAEERGYLRKERQYNSSVIYTITVPMADVVRDMRKADSAQVDDEGCAESGSSSEAM